MINGVNHEIPFNDPVVKNAAEYLSQIMHTPDYVVGGTDAIVSTFFGNAQTQCLKEMQMATLVV